MADKDAKAGKKSPAFKYLTTQMNDIPSYPVAKSINLFFFFNLLRQGSQSLG